MTDLRLAARMIAKQPGMAALATVALALGIGLTTTMFRIVNGAVSGIAVVLSQPWWLASFRRAERPELIRWWHSGISKA